MPTALIPRIITVLTNQQHRIDIEFVGPGMQRAANARINRHAMLLGQPDADIAFEHMVDIHRDHLDLGREETFVCGHALEKFCNDGVGV